MLGWFPAAGELAWPLVVALAWAAGEVVARWQVPRIGAYAVIGFVFSPSVLGVLPAQGGPGALLANIAFGLMLFEFGYRINLHWFRINPWLTATGLLESLLSAVAVYALAHVLGASTLTALLLASLAMVTSPAALVRAVNELRSSGQVTERALHLAALDCVLAVFAFKTIVGFWTFDSSGDIVKALSDSAVVLVVSAALGGSFGALVPAVLARFGRYGNDRTLAFAISVVVLVAVAQALRYSPLIATLAFGLVARHRRVTLDQAQRNFGVLGELLAVVLFVHVAAAVDWPRVVSGLALGLGLVLARGIAKVLGTSLLARPSGTTWRKGALTGLAMMPMSVFVVLLIEDSRQLGVDLMDTLAPLAAATLVLDLLGPLITQLALRAAGETQRIEGTPDRQKKERHGAGTVQDL